MVGEDRALLAMCMPRAYSHSSAWPPPLRSTLATEERRDSTSDPFVGPQQDSYAEYVGQQPQ
jgi:hypothetical protein